MAVEYPGTRRANAIGGVLPGIDGYRLTVPRDTTHGPRVDERLAQEAAGQARGDDPSPVQALDGHPGGAERDTGTRLSAVDDPAAGAAEAAVRRELQDRLSDIEYPATRNDLLRHVGGDERGQLQAHLRSLPAETTFPDVGSVVRSFGAIHSEE